MSMRNTMVVARRELLERVKSKWFVVMTLLGPVFMVALVVIPALIASHGASGTRVELIDHSGRIGAPLKSELDKLLWKPVIIAPDTVEQTELDRIRDNKINGYIVVPQDALDGGEIVYRGDNASSQAVSLTLQFTVNAIVQQERGLRAGFTKEQLGH